MAQKETTPTPITRRDFLRIGAGTLAATGLTAGQISHSSRVSEAAMPEPSSRKCATRVILGGRIEGKESDDPYGLFKELREVSGFTDKTVVCVTSAHNDPRDCEDGALHYQQLFKRLGAARVVTIKNLEEAQDPAIAQFLKSPDCPLIYFGGGDQEILHKAFAGTLAHKAVQARLADPDFTIAGNSAGAAIMPDIMIADWNKEVTGAKTSPGLGFLPGFKVDTHMNRWKRLPTHLPRDGRFQKAVQDSMQNGRCCGVGLDEGTGLVITNWGHGDCEEGRVIGVGKAYWTGKSAGKEWAYTPWEPGQVFNPRNGAEITPLQVAREAPRSR